MAIDDFRNKFTKVKKILILFIFVPVLLYAQEAKPVTAENDFFYFENEETGKPIFTQIISWKGSASVFYYEISVKDSLGSFILESEKTETSSIEVKLKPGKYFYKILAYNFLDTLEQESDWVELEILQAVFPAIRSISPNILYIENNDFSFEVKGRNFPPNADIFFQSEKTHAKKFIKPLSIEKNKIDFYFDNPEVFIGSPYTVHIVDKSGLSAVSSPFLVKYKKAVDFYVGAAYTPYVPLGDAWYMSVWNKKFYPFGFTGELGFIFSKNSFGFFGLELRSSFRLMNTEKDSVKLNNNTVVSSLNFIYEWWFIRKLALCIRAGGGIVYNSYVFVYPTWTSDKQSTLDGFYTAALGFRVKPVKNFYFDVMIGVEHMLNREVKPLGIIPEIAFGYRF
ncbi:MAG: hypothetical protein ACTTHG_04685 [Treponemataceae bacterium]